MKVGPNQVLVISGRKRRMVDPDGTVRDEFRLARGWWEAKDTSDKLASEIQKKIKAGYPTRNTIFEDTQTAVLYQDRGEAGEYALGEPLKIAELMNRFFSHNESDEREFQRAMDEFKSRIWRNRSATTSTKRTRRTKSSAKPSPRS